MMRTISRSDSVCMYNHNSTDKEFASTLKQEGDAQQHNMMMADGSRAVQVQEIRLLCCVVPAAAPAPAAATTSSRI
eukprot:scaffold7025_cov225-Skeletonema_marinoi.AAC.5